MPEAGKQPYMHEVERAERLLWEQLQRCENPRDKAELETVYNTLVLLKSGWLDRRSRCLDLAQQVDELRRELDYGKGD